MNPEIIIPVAFFICVGFVAALFMVGHHRYTEQRHQTLRAMVEKGAQIPPELLAPPKQPPNPHRDLRRGILLVCAGLGLGLFFLIEDGWDEAALGLIPIFIGIGYLIVSRIERSPRGEQVLAP